VSELCVAGVSIFEGMSRAWCDCDCCLHLAGELSATSSSSNGGGTRPEVKWVTFEGMS
jgi:hypothetical protein